MKGVYTKSAFRQNKGKGTAWTGVNAASSSAIKIRSEITDSVRHIVQILFASMAEMSK